VAVQAATSIIKWLYFLFSLHCHHESLATFSKAASMPLIYDHVNNC